MTQILVIEDEDRIATFVAKGLKSAGYATQRAATAKEGFEAALSGDPDLIVLDLGLPDGDGLELLARMRASGVGVPVIILTARRSVDDTVAGLEGGADDYMAKPFGFDELLARIRLRLRVESQGEATTLSHGSLSLDLRTRRATIESREVDLSAREFTLAETLLRNPGQALSREQLLSRVWGYDFDPGSNVVDVYVRYLRAKIGADRIETVRGVGYRLVAPRPGTGFS
ncbi:transcriptional activator protein CopR [Demequina sediminis]|uniref:Transcriptional activator protein CopR n=1 Tax=Demequina sediminis TaxID=1930058 RepID=A0ABP9WGA5_9MICO|nr:response regulator transcription factor [Demequina sediminis]BDZ60909.1 DNA-binding response regulator [Demequina sediminis]